MTKILTELCAIPGPSGFEAPIAGRVIDLLAPYMDETWTDVMGSVIAVRRCGKPDVPKLMFDAHIDEPGLIVTHVEEGFLRFAPLGGVDARILPASEVTVLSNPPIKGVVGALPPHVIKKEDADKTIKIEDMFIDIGLNQAEAEAAVPLGSAAVLSHGARRLGESRLRGKALDDRAGVAAVLRALELIGGAPLDVDLYVMASTQEEVGVRGAAPGAFSVAPDYCVVIDVGHAKTPDSKPHETSGVLGGGVIISRGPNMNPRFTERAINLADERGIKHQIDVEPGGNSGTNARAIQISRGGVATALLGIPMRYMHSSYETVSEDDIESAACLLCEIARRGVDA